MITFHIRRQLSRKRGSQWYKDKTVRTVSTYCGADVTQWDINWNSKALSIADRIPCEACIIARG